MTPRSSNHARILAECYQILRQAAVRAAQTRSNAAGANGGAAAEEVRDAGARSST